MKSHPPNGNPYDPPHCGHLYVEVMPPRRRRPAAIGRLALRMVASVSIALAGAQWGMVVEVRRARAVEHRQELRMVEACHPELGHQRPAIADLWYPTPSP